MLYRINNATIALGGEEILSYINFEIRGKEKIAITGRNGAGKTTLLRFIAGELEAERDDKRTGPVVETDRNLSIGMLKQTPADMSDMTVTEIMQAVCGGWEFDRIFTGFGFKLEDRQRRLSSFSGGEQTRIALIRLLLEKPDIMLLDEPTNHLDVKAVEWLEGYLKGYDKAVIFVSHDRFFMDRVADIVCEVENRSVVRYVGNYTAFRAQKLKNIELARRAWERNEQELERLNALIERFKNKPRKAAFARSRRTIIERMEHLEKPREDTAHIFTGEIVPEHMSGKWVVDAEHLKCGYRIAMPHSPQQGDNVIIELSLKMQRGRKVAITGDNGTGKSTFLRTVAGLQKPLSGKCTLGNGVEIGYFDQLSAQISSSLTVIEYFRQAFPNMDERELRGTLADYLFRGRDAQKTVDSLSGGEKARLVLAIILCRRPNFLILDEPTNHMDIEARETLESALQAYTGTVLVVSHDRYLVSRLAESFYILSEGSAMYYPFSYTHYLERLETLNNTAPGTDRDITGLIRAEDEALIEKLQAVPRRERHEIHFADIDEAVGDWELRLAEEELEGARQGVETADSAENYEKALETLAYAEKKWYDIYRALSEAETRNGCGN